MSKKKILVIDDDKNMLEFSKAQLTKSGYETYTLNDSALAMEKINLYKPDVLIVDLLMPKVDGYALIENIRKCADLNDTKIIVVSAKAFKFDHNRVYEMGANAYLNKPFKYENLEAEIKSVLRNEIKITFWGTRGTIPKPGKSTLKFGGNTSCVSVELTKNRLFIFDAGTGIIELGEYLNSNNKRHKMNLLITHPHWDHIHGFPFFWPIYKQGNELAVYGTPHGNISLREVMSGQMESIYFPVTIREFASRVYFREISEGDYEIEGLSVKTMLLIHPGITLGYKIKDTDGKSMAYITDNEIDRRGEERHDTYTRHKLAKFLNKVDVLIHDSSYSDDEYKRRVGWGHPPITEVLKLAADAEVKSLYLSHHDPSHNDDKVAEKEAYARRYFEERNLDIQCSAAIEGSSVII